MSHTVTITRTTTTSTGTAYFVNTGYVCTTTGLLKLAQLVLGAVCVGIMGAKIDKSNYGYNEQQLFFFLVAVAFLIGTFCLVTSGLISLSTASLMSKTVYEVVYHGLAFILYLIAGLVLLIEITGKETRYKYREKEYDWYLAASIIGLVVSALYLLSAFMANRIYRGI